MQRLFNIGKWQLLEDGKAVNFGNRTPRRVRIDVNTASRAALYYSDDDGDVTLLASVHGRDVIEFGCGGAFAMTAEGADVWFHTVDGEDYSFIIPDAVILTKIAERRARNPEFELMQYKMNENLERRMEQQRLELEQLWARQLTNSAAAAAQPAATGANGGSGSEPPPASGADGDAGGDQPSA